MPYFSTIIATFNRGNLIRPTLDSAFAQDGVDPELHEIIVVDDGSTDDTSMILGEYTSRYPDRLRIFRQDNAGPGKARNLGICEAKGRYVCFLDSDDLWFPWTLSVYRKLIKQYAEPSFLIGTAIPFSNASALPQSINDDQSTILDFADFYSAASIDLWHGCSVVVVRADALRAAGGFQEANVNAEDTDLWMKLGVAPCFVLVQTPATVGYREHPSSAVADMQKTFQGMLHLIEQEKTQRYPGGPSRRKERLTILTRHLRAASMHCLSAGKKPDAWSLYWKSFAWNAKQGRLKYLLGFPSAAIGII